MKFCTDLGLPSVLTFAPTTTDMTHDGMRLSEACRKLQVEDGADVVGLNCHRGPEMILPLIKEIREVCPVSAHYLIHFVVCADLDPLQKQVLVLIENNQNPKLG